MRINNHWLLPAIHCKSPNHDQRPDVQDISLIVIHCISLPPGQFDNDYISQLFCNELDPKEHAYFRKVYNNPVSAHALIKRNGAIIQYVAFNLRAWHAGESEYVGRSRCNDFSIGIELEGTEQQPYLEQQYQSLAQIIHSLIKTYPKLSKQRITGHSNIAPERKTDPGDSFDWRKLYRILDSHLARD